MTRIGVARDIGPLGPALGLVRMAYSAWLLVALLVSAGCVRQVTVSTMGGIFQDGMSAVEEEQDPEFAAQSLPSSLKLMEVLLKSDPENRKLLLLLAEGYSSYALGFVEDTDPERAKIFYQRATGYALRLVRQDRTLGKALDGPLDGFLAELALRGKPDVPGIFWAAFGMGGYLNLAFDKPDALALLPRVEAMMQFVAAADPAFFHGGADTFLGTLYGGRARMLGGNPERSRKHFENALRINGGAFLMTKVFFARTYAVQTQNEALFSQLLAEIEGVPLDKAPQLRLVNAVAKRKALLLRSRKDDLF
ncbi:MAG: TRAP transporter TatT component family protein [Candidatus Methylomirabilia bacterium]